MLHLLAPGSDRRAAWLGRGMALFTLALLSSTWQLWIPQTVYPQVPLVAAAGSVPAWADWGLLAVLVTGLLGCLAAPLGHRAGRSCLMVSALALSGLFLIDQHRLQPWAYHYVLTALVLVLIPPAAALRWLGWLLVSVYTFSAISKLDYDFLHTLGQTLFAALVGLAGLKTDLWSDQERLLAAMSLPGVELLIGLGLLIPGWRTIALTGAITLHVALILALGPRGLNHQPAVLLWNGCFIFQLLVLFAGGCRQRFTASAPPNDSSPQGLASAEAAAAALPSSRDRRIGVSSSHAAGIAVAAFALVAPVLEWLGHFDHWPAWGLYSTRTSQVQLFILPRGTERLPEELRSFLVPSRANPPWNRLALDRWSIAAVGAPIYPQDRFQLGVARAVIQRFGLQDAILVIRAHPPDRWNGQRLQDTWYDLEQIDRQAKFWFNAQPRGRFWQDHSPRNLPQAHSQ